MARIRSIVYPALHIGIESGIDTETTVTGSCSFRTGTLNAEGNPVAIGALVRLEADIVNRKVRVTVRAKHILISEAIKSAIQTELG